MSKLYKEEITCPYCGSEFTDSWQWNDLGEDAGNEECWKCGKEFKLFINFEVTYSTYEIEEQK